MAMRVHFFMPDGVDTMLAPRRQRYKNLLWFARDIVSVDSVVGGLGPTPGAAAKFTSIARFAGWGVTAGDSAYVLKRDSQLVKFLDRPPQPLETTSAAELFDMGEQQRARSYTR